MGDRRIVYPGALPASLDMLYTNKYAHMALAKLAGAVLGTSTLLNGFACAPTSPAGLTVNVAPGEIYSLQDVDASAYGSIAADATHLIVKQGIALDATNLACPAPGSAGYSINYLVEIAFSEQDGFPAVLNYYNSANPSQPYSGPGNTGEAQNTVRRDLAVVAVKAGVAAPTGTQATPAIDPGYVGAWVVTVANGQTQITSGNISGYSGAPFLSETLIQKISQATADGRYVQFAQIQNCSMVYASDATNTNAYAASITPAISSLPTPLWVLLKATNTNTSAAAATLALNGLPAKPITYRDGTAIAPGALQGLNLLFYDGTNFELHSAQKPVGGIAGQVSNLTCTSAGASTSLTMYFDEAIVETALLGTPYKVSAPSTGAGQTVNLANTGAGGVDNGPSSLAVGATGYAGSGGYVGIYEIYNPATGAAALLAQNSYNTVLPTVYGGAYMPAGYTASALLGVYPINSSKQFTAFAENGGIVAASIITVLSAGGAGGSTPVSLATAVPPNAKWWGGSILSNVANTFMTIGANTGLSQQSVTATATPVQAPCWMPITAQQNVNYNITGSGSGYIYVSAYKVRG